MMGTTLRNIIICLAIIGVAVYVKTYGWVLPGNGPKGIHNQEMREFEAQYNNETPEK